MFALHLLTFCAVSVFLFYLLCELAEGIYLDLTANKRAAAAAAKRAQEANEFEEWCKAAMQECVESGKRAAEENKDRKPYYL